MPVDGRDALPAPGRIAQREVCLGMLALDDVRVLAHVEGAVRAPEKGPGVPVDRLGRTAVAHVAELPVGKRIDPHIFSLHLHDLLEVDVLPVAVRGVLVGAAPHRVDQVEGALEGLPGHSPGRGVPLPGAEETVLDRVPVEVLVRLKESTAPRVVGREIAALEHRAHRLGQGGRPSL